MRKKYRFKDMFVPKFLFVTIAFILFLIFLLGRVAYISIVLGKEYEYEAVTQHTNRVVDTLITPKRGEILDRNGEKIATSVTIYDVIFDIRVFMSEDSNLTDEKREEYLQKVSEIIDVPYEELKGYTAKNADGTLVYDTAYKKIKTGLSYDDGKIFENESLPSSFYLEAKSKRLYPYDNFASQVIGFMRGDNVESYWGLEKFYNDYLLGEYGRYYRTYDENGLIVTSNISETNGDTVTLTLDTTIQNLADDLTEKYGEMYRAENASAIVMDPNTGEILALSNYASFNNNSPSNEEEVNSSIFKEEYSTLETEDEKSELLMKAAWRNFSITDTYEPGSVFKPIVLAGALEEGLIDLNYKFYCPGYIMIGDQRIPCWNTNGHGEQTTVEALAHSCNPAIIQMIQILGKEKFYEYQKDFGYGELTGIDLPAETNASEYIYSIEGLNPVELATSAMGQGFTTTAIQNIVAFASLINGGNLLQPYVVSQVSGEDGTTKLVNSTKIIKQTISEETSDQIRTLLQAVVAPGGTGSKSIIEGYNIGGKTGTAQQGDRTLNLHTVSYIAYFPVEDPQYIINVIVHIPETYVDNVTSVVPMGKELIEGIISYKNIPPSNVYNIDDTSYFNSNKMIAENYVGRNIVDVTKEINGYGYNFDISGKGEIISKQIPEAGTEINKDSTIFLYVSEEDSSGVGIGTGTGTDETTQENENSDVENSEKPVETVSSLEYNAVPNIIGLTESEAIKVLESMGFEYKVTVNTNNVVTEENTEAEENEDGQEGSVSISTIGESEVGVNMVVEQMPKADVLLPKGTEIRIITE